MSRPRRPPILLTGAIGYVGGRLLRVLEERGEWVRCLDRQVEGPFRLWEHTHLFEERPDGPLIHDIVLYRMPYGPLGAIAHRVLVARDLERIFDYRRDAVDRLLGGRHNRPAPVGSER